MSRFVLPLRNIVRNASTDMTVKSKLITYKQSLMNIPETRVTVADNTIRVASENNGKELATVAVFIGCGSRYEQPDVNGAANFYEHMAFKGTNKRTQKELELELDHMGAQFNAYTARDYQVFYAKCLKDDVPQAVEILSDIIQHSKLDEEDIEKEKAVILKEIEAAGHNFTTVSYDYLHQTAFQGNCLGQPVCGKTQNVKNMAKIDLEDHRNCHFKPSRMVLAGAGGVNHDQLVELASKHFDSLTSNFDGIVPDPGRARFSGAELTVRNDDLAFGHYAMGFPTVGWKHDDHLTLQVASMIIGSWDRTYGGSGDNASKLAQISYKKKYCHAFQQFNLVYDDIALWGTYFVCERMEITDFADALADELVRISSEATEFEVERAKNNLRSNLLVQLDGTTAICEHIGKQMLFYGRRVDMSELDEKLEAITASTVRKAMMKYIYDMDFAMSGIGPTEALQDYQDLRSRIYRFRI